MASAARLNKILDHLSENNAARNIGIGTQHCADNAKRTMDEIERRFQELVGCDLGASTWMTLKQGDLDTFSDLTYDHNWIHKKGAAQKGSPFGDTVAHGLLTLSMLPRAVYQVNAKYLDEMSLRQVKSGVNYGFDKVRFIAPVFVDSKIRARFKLKSACKGNKQNSIKYIFDVTMETKDKNTGKITDALFAEWCGMTIYRQ